MNDKSFAAYVGVSRLSSAMLIYNDLDLVDSNLGHDLMSGLFLRYSKLMSVPLACRTLLNGYACS